MPTSQSLLSITLHMFGHHWIRRVVCPEVTPFSGYLDPPASADLPGIHLATVISVHSRMVCELL